MNTVRPPQLRAQSSAPALRITAARLTSSATKAGFSHDAGAGFYHMLLDTLASISFLSTVVGPDATATFLLNPCTTGRDHLQGAAGQLL